MNATVTAGELLRRLLAVAGVDAVYGAPLEGVPVTPVADPITSRRSPAWTAAGVRWTRRWAARWSAR